MVYIMLCLCTEVGNTSYFLAITLATVVILDSSSGSFIYDLLSGTTTRILWHLLYTFSQAHTQFLVPCSRETGRNRGGWRRGGGHVSPVRCSRLCWRWGEHVHTAHQHCVIRVHCQRTRTNTNQSSFTAVIVFIVFSTQVNPTWCR